ncbi:MAG: hypothetical protein AB1744_11830 [Candidatus Zixiibacteriota bacterium]
MDTHARLREQRKRGWRHPATFFGLGFGLAVGLSLSLLLSSRTEDSFGPYLAAVLISYGLGGLTILIYWWLSDRRQEASLTTKQVTGGRDSEARYHRQFVFFVLGSAGGLGFGLALWAARGDFIWPQWAAYVFAYLLGGVICVAYWWLMGFTRNRRKVTETA